MAQQQIPLHYAAGQVCHTTFLVDDVDKANAFFANVFGWNAKNVSGENHYLTVFDNNGLPAIGIGNNEGSAPPITIYVNVASLAVAANEVQANGGKVLGGPVEVPGMGIWQFFQAPGTDAPFALWQDANAAPKDARTWTHHRDLGTIVGRPIGCANPQQTAEFFNNVFGWSVKTEVDPNTDAEIYVFDDNGGSGGAFFPLNANIDLNPVEVHILVRNLDEAIENITANGGTTVGSAVDFPGWGTKQDVRIPGGPVIQVWDDTTRAR